MTIVPVSSSISSGYDNAEVQKLKLKSGKEELSQKTGNSTENAVVESKRIESKSELSFEDSSTVRTSLYGDTVEISKQGMSKAQGMSATPNSVSAEQSTETVSTTSSTEDLSSDSVYDLKQKLVKGTITQSEYDNEIKKRGKDTESAEVDSSTKSE